MRKPPLMFWGLGSERRWADSRILTAGSEALALLVYFPGRPSPGPVSFLIGILIGTAGPAVGPREVCHRPSNLGTSQTSLPLLVEEPDHKNGP